MFLQGKASLLEKNQKQANHMLEYMVHMAYNRGLALRSFSMLGITMLPFFMYEALKPSTESMISGGRTNLEKKKKSNK